MAYDPPNGWAEQGSSIPVLVEGNKVLEGNGEMAKLLGPFRVNSSSNIDSEWQLRRMNMLDQEGHKLETMITVIVLICSFQWQS